MADKQIVQFMFKVDELGSRRLVYNNVLYKYVRNLVLRFFVDEHIEGNIEDINYFVDIALYVIELKLIRYRKLFYQFVLKSLRIKTVCLNRFMNNLSIYRNFNYLPVFMCVRDSLKITRLRGNKSWFVKSLDTWILNIMNNQRELFMDTLIKRLEQLSREVFVIPLLNGIFYLSIENVLFTMDENSIMLKFPSVKDFVIKSLQCYVLNDRGIDFDIEKFDCSIDLRMISLNMMLGDDEEGGVFTDDNINVLNLYMSDDEVIVSDNNNNSYF